MDLTEIKLRKFFTVSEYLNQLRKLLPPGIIWGFDMGFVTGVIQDSVTGEELQDNTAGDTIQDSSADSEMYLSGSNLGKLFSVMADELSRCDTRTRDLMNGVIPGLSEDLLPDWERVLGIPGECETTDTLGTLEERRTRVHLKYTRASVTTTPDFFVQYASGLGWDISIAEDTVANEAFSVGAARVGRNRIGGNRSYAYVIITVNSGTGDLDKLKCLFEQLKPAHLVLVWE